MLAIRRIREKDIKTIEREWDGFDETIGVMWKEERFAFGAFYDDKLAGYATLKITGGVGHIHELFVFEGRRGKGIGRALVQEIESFCKGKGCHKITMRTSERHKAAFELYKKLGYQTEAVMRNDKFKLTWYLMCKELA